MKFKPGDKVQYVGPTRNPNYLSHTPNPNEIGEFIDYSSDKQWVIVHFKSYEKIYKRSRCDYLIEDLRFVRDEPKNDIEWLDAIQNNFKEGV